VGGLKAEIASPPHPVRSKKLQQMFFYLGPKRAEISDASLPLIETYRAVAKSPLEMLKFLRPLKPSKANFIRLRQYPRTLRRFRTVRIPTVDDVGVRYK